jgi:lysozyme
MEEDMPEDLDGPWDGSVPVAATAVVKRIEQFAANPYEDNPGNPKSTWTIGYGSIHDATGAPITAGTPPISQADAETLLMNEMRGTAEEVRTVVTVRMLTREAAALISWTYNLGGPNLEGSTMLRRLNNNDKRGAADEMRRWINQGGRPLLGLLRRRWAEAAIFLGSDPTQACDRAWVEITALDQWPAFA